MVRAWPKTRPRRAHLLRRVKQRRRRQTPNLRRPMNSKTLALVCTCKKLTMVTHSGPWVATALSTSLRCPKVFSMVILCLSHGPQVCVSRPLLISACLCFLSFAVDAFRWLLRSLCRLLRRLLWRIWQRLQQHGVLLRPEFRKQLRERRLVIVRLECWKCLWSRKHVQLAVILRLLRSYGCSLRQQRLLWCHGCSLQQFGLRERYGLLRQHRQLCHQQLRFCLCHNARLRWLQHGIQ